MVGGLAEGLRQARDLAVIPLGTVVKTNLTVNLVLVRRTSLRKRFKEEIALARNRHINRRANTGVDEKRRGFRNVGVRHDTDHAKRGNEVINLDAVDFTSGGNHRHAVAGSVGVQLHKVDRAHHKHQTVSGSMRVADRLEQFCDHPEIKSRTASRFHVGSNRTCNTARFVSDVVVSAVLIHAVQERELNVVLHRLHRICNLKIQFVRRVRNLSSVVQAGKLPHRGLLAIRDRQRLLENLTDVRVLRARHKFRRGSGQRASFGNSRLCRAAARGIRERSGETPMLNGAGLAANQRAKRSFGVALVEEHAAIIQQIVGSHNGRFISSHSFFSPLSFVLLLLLEPHKRRNSRHITASVRIRNPRTVIHRRSGASDRRFRRFLHELFAQGLFEVFRVFSLVINLRFPVAVHNRFCLCSGKFGAPTQTEVFILHIREQNSLFQFRNTGFRIRTLLLVLSHLPLVFCGLLHHLIELLLRIHTFRRVVTLQGGSNFFGGHIVAVFFTQNLFQIHLLSSFCVFLWLLCQKMCVFTTSLSHFNGQQIAPTVIMRFIWYFIDGVDFAVSFTARLASAVIQRSNPFHALNAAIRECSQNRFVFDVDCVLLRLPPPCVCGPTDILPHRLLACVGHERFHQTHSLSLNFVLINVLRHRVIRGKQYGNHQQRVCFLLLFKTRVASV
uniref:Uncharacterized protein n=1 Tax=Siphoviridae sp. ctDmR33 TaxID=2825389 RepID=A0A8S5UX52_9CAUD|nr:MAG TPA: hypothetical protein [Siphoviridae sp. ctDmR33]